MFPSKGVGGAEYPYVLAGMIEEWGGQIIDYPERRHCCGFGFRQYLVQANRGFSIACSKEKFESMKPFQTRYDNYKLSWLSDVPRQMAVCNK